MKGKSMLLRNVSDSHVRELIKIALREDKVFQDITTTAAVIPPSLQGQGELLAKQKGVIAGLRLAAEVFRLVDSRVKCRALVKEGRKVSKGTRIAEISGPVSSILKAERTVLNFIQHLSGIATLTASFVEQLKGTGVVLLDTRKTLPGLRLLQKAAVSLGGGTNHRMHLSEAVMLKDNHLQAVAMEPAICNAVRAVKGRVPVIVEITKVSQAIPAIKAGATRLLLDNMPVSQMRQVVKLAKGRVELEASGGIQLNNIRAIARSGVDFISVGALTHSAKGLDISLELTNCKKN